MRGLLLLLAACDGVFGVHHVDPLIELGDRFAFTDHAPFSVEAWVLNGRDSQFNYAILSKWRQFSTTGGPASGWLFYYQEGADLIPSFRFQRQDAGGIGPSTQVVATAGPAWHHVAATFDGTTIAIYLDGNYGSSMPSSVAIETLPEPFEIGAQNGNPHDGPMLGSLDEIAIYDYALSDLRIRAHYDARSL